MQTEGSEDGSISLAPRSQSLLHFSERVRIPLNASGSDSANCVRDADLSRNIAKADHSYQKIFGEGDDVAAEYIQLETGAEKRIRVQRIIHTRVLLSLSIVVSALPASYWQPLPRTHLGSSSILAPSP